MNGWHTSASRRGFTIVELLIVIVIIAILATITVVAYNGVQQRAKNSQVIAGVQAYKKALLQYNTLNSTYPSAAGCLGDQYPGNQCWVGSSGNWSVSATLDGNLATVMTNKPVLVTSLMPIGIGDNTRAGAVYVVSPSRIIYYLSGPGQDCGIGGVTAVTEGNVVTQCALALP